MNSTQEINQYGHYKKIICKRCGTLSSCSNFCPNCGAELKQKPRKTNKKMSYIYTIIIAITIGCALLMNASNILYNLALLVDEYYNEYYDVPYYGNPNSEDSIANMLNIEEGLRD